MDVRGFADDLLLSLASTGLFENVALHTEGPVADGQAHVAAGLFLRFYFNEVTGTTAFALVEKQRRIWGIDYNNRRWWHVHPADNPTDHVCIEPLSVPDVVGHLKDVLPKLRLAASGQ